MRTDKQRRNIKKGGAGDTARNVLERGVRNKYRFNYAAVKTLTGRYLVRISVPVPTERKHLKTTITYSVSPTFIQLAKPTNLLPI